MARLRAATHVWTPWPGFGEYAAAAEALGLSVHRYSGIDGLAEGVSACRAAGERAPMLVWVCDPCNPSGGLLDGADWAHLQALSWADNLTSEVI